MTADYVELPGSHRDPSKELPAIASVRAVNPSEEIEVSVYLKDRGPDPLLQPPITADEAAAKAQSAQSFESLIAQRKNTMLISTPYRNLFPRRDSRL